MIGGELKLALFPLFFSSMAFFGDVWSPPLCPGPLFSFFLFLYIRVCSLSRLSPVQKENRIHSLALSAITWRRLTLASHHVLFLFLGQVHSLSLSSYVSLFFFFPFFQYRQHIQQVGSCQFSGFHFPHDLSSQTVFFSFLSLFIFSFNSFLFQPLSETIVEIALTGDCLDAVFLLLHWAPLGQVQRELICLHSVRCLVFIWILW